MSQYFDVDTMTQLKEVFSKLTQDVVLNYSPSSHESQKDLLEMLSALTEVSPKIKLIEGETTSLFPRFFIQGTGVEYFGIPGGHEFSSLVLSILNASKVGVFPSERLQEKILRLKKNQELKTFVSLTCENCPDVVQFMNQVAILHPSFKHITVEGSLFESEIKQLGIQGVPSIIHNGKLIHSGRIEPADLIKKLEEAIGIEENAVKREAKCVQVSDVAVVGGGPAGVSASIYSARKGFKTALISDRIGGQVLETKGIENFISLPYTEGPELSASLKKHLEQYPVERVNDDRVRSVEKLTSGYFKLLLESGDWVETKNLIVASGAKWRELNVPGEKEYLGRGVAFCPHCDGPFYKGKDVAVIGGGNSGVEAAIDLAQIVSNVTLIEYNQALKADQVLVDKLKTFPNIKVKTNFQTKSIEGNGQKVTSIQLLNRQNNEIENLGLDGVFVQIGLVPNSQFLKGVVEMNPFGEILVDSKGRTSVPGIYAAGDVTQTPFKQIIIAMGEGARTALTVFEDWMKK